MSKIEFTKRRLNNPFVWYKAVYINFSSSNLEFHSGFNKYPRHIFAAFPAIGRSGRDHLMIKWFLVKYSRKINIGLKNPYVGPYYVSDVTELRKIHGLLS